MRLIEVIEGDDTSAETAQAAANFAQAIRKMPVRCAECPGFVVNRILVSTASEIWRYQDETGRRRWRPSTSSSPARAQMPMGPFRVADMSGLDTTVKVARDLREAYGDRFYVHRGMEELVARGDLGPRRGKGFYDTPTTPQIDERIADRFQLKAFVEACLVLEEGVAGVRDIDMGLMLGTGMVPGPFARADLRGLDDVLAALDRARGGVGRRLRAAARRCAGSSPRAGWAPRAARASTRTRSPTPGYEQAPVKLDTRGEIAIAWLDNPPANSSRPHVVEAR